MEMCNTVVVRVPTEKVWEFVWDVQRMVSCIPGCHTAHTMEAGKQYLAEVPQKVGPFLVDLPLQIMIKEQRPPHHLVAIASGQDKRVGINVIVELQLDLKERESTHQNLSNCESKRLGKAGHPWPWTCQT